MNKKKRRYKEKDSGIRVRNQIIFCSFEI